MLPEEKQACFSAGLPAQVRTTPRRFSPGNLPTQTGNCCLWTPCGCSSPAGSPGRFSQQHPSRTGRSGSPPVGQRLAARMKTRKPVTGAGKAERSSCGGPGSAELLRPRTQESRLGRRVCGTCFSGLRSSLTPPISRIPVVMQVHFHLNSFTVFSPLYTHKQWNCAHSSEQQDFNCFHSKANDKWHFLRALFTWKTLACKMPHLNYQLVSLASHLFKLNWQNSFVLLKQVTSVSLTMLFSPTAAHWIDKCELCPTVADRRITVICTIYVIYSQFCISIWKQSLFCMCHRIATYSGTKKLKLF